TKIAALDAMLLFMFTLSVYAFTRGLESRKWFIISLIVTGLTVATKFNAVTLFVLLPVIYFIHRRPKAIGKKHLLLIPFVSAAVLYLVWPRLWFDPIGGLLANFNWWQSLGDVSEYFLGGLSHPIYYMATYVVVTTPVLILATLALGVYYSARHRDGENLTLLAWLLIPLFVYSFYHFRQAGPRYVIMIYPAVAMLAGIGIHRISSWLSGMHRFNARKTAVYMAIPFIVFVYLLAVDVSVHPYYLDYYNELVGGPGNVYNNHMFAIGQWGEGIGEAAFWLNSNAKPNSTVQYFVQPRHAVPFPSRMRADLTDITPFIPKYISGTENINWDMTNVTPEADYLVENTFFRLYMNESFHADIAGSYELIKTIDVQGAPLAWVYTRK
ncbi:MAG: hypothetical protein FJY76_02855, partial [Candidatus Aenigmarchaeota archaeon]|nr:hypothetical protein [Candidatus Aenigmarchaeota archaeon]